MDDLFDFESSPKASSGKKYVTGWIMLPCFKVMVAPFEDGCVQLFDGFLEKVFNIFFAPLWTGKVHFNKSEWEKLNNWERELLSHDS